MACTRVLTDDDFVVPPAVGYGWAPGGIGWLRASVARFSSGDTHRRRRAMIEAELSRVDTAAIRAAAYARALGESDVDSAARTVPVAVLAEALGVPDVPVPAVAAVAAVYLTGSSGGPPVQAALDALVAACGGVPDEPTAAVIGLLVQAYEATATLAMAAVPTGAATGDEAVALALRATPPVPRTRRVAVVDTRVDGQRIAAGKIVQVSLARAPFGAGAHACPGRELAMATAAAIVDAVRR